MNLRMSSASTFMLRYLTKDLPERYMFTLCGDYQRSLQLSLHTPEPRVHVQKQSVALRKDRHFICQA
jgi:hypothetical protein